MDVEDEPEICVCAVCKRVFFSPPYAGLPMECDECAMIEIESRWPTQAQQEG